MLFNELKGLICPFYRFVGQVVTTLMANLQMFVKVISEVVGSVASSAFNHLLIPTTMIEFIVIKRGAIQGFKEPTVLTAQFV